MSGRHGEGAASLATPATIARSVRCGRMVFCLLSRATFTTFGGRRTQRQTRRRLGMDLSTVLGSNEFAYTTAESNNVTLGTAVRVVFTRVHSHSNSKRPIDLTNQYNLVALQAAPGSGRRRISPRAFQHPAGHAGLVSRWWRSDPGWPKCRCSRWPGCAGFPGFRPTDAGSQRAMPKRCTSTGAGVLRPLAGFSRRALRRLQ